VAPPHQTDPDRSARFRANRTAAAATVTRWWPRASAEGAQARLPALRAGGVGDTRPV